MAVGSDTLSEALWGPFSQSKWDTLHNYVADSLPMLSDDEQAIRQVMWHCDMKAVRDLGHSLTGATWFKTEEGVDAKEVQ